MREAIPSKIQNRMNDTYGMDQEYNEQGDLMQDHRNDAVNYANKTIDAFDKTASKFKESTTENAQIKKPVFVNPKFEIIDSLTNREEDKRKEEELKNKQRNERIARNYK